MVHIYSEFELVFHGFAAKFANILCLSAFPNLVCKLVPKVGKEGNVLFNDAFNTFYLQLYGINHMVKDHSESERRNPLSLHGLLFPISSKGSFICIIPQTG